MRNLVAATCVLALTGCPTVELGNAPDEIGVCNPTQGLTYFLSDIEPTYLRLQDPVNGCARSMCHDLAHSGTLVLETAAPVDDQMNYRAVQASLNCGTPTASPLLTKPLAGIDAHQGGDIFANLDDPRVVDFLAWFQ